MRVAIYGWDEDAAEAWRALTARPGVIAVAIGDGRHAALVRARAATGLPCSSYPLEMLRTAEYDVALIATASQSERAVDIAARRGSGVALLGAATDGTTLLAAAEAAHRYGAALAVMRPALATAGSAALLGRGAEDRGWQPRYLELTVTGNDDAARLLRDAVAMATRLMPGPPDHVTASYLGDTPEEAPAFTADLRYADGRLASLRARTEPAPGVTVHADGALGVLEWQQTANASSLSIRRRDGSGERTRLPHRDTMVLEAERAVAALRAGRGDATTALIDGAVLLALESALHSGDVTPVLAPSSRANLRLLPGATGHRPGPSMRPASRHLHLVGS